MFPELQGGPFMHTIAAKAACFEIARTQAFREYQGQVKANAAELATGLMGGGLHVLSEGTDTHLVQLDLRQSEWSGRDAEERLHEVSVTVNRNTVPFDERPPAVASGVRLGTPAVTMRGFDESDVREVASIIVDALAPDCDVAAVRERALALCAARPLYAGRRGAAQVELVEGWARQPDEERLVVVAHPLVRHKLGLLRDVTTTTQMFRQLVNELTLLLTYEATKDLATEIVDIDTPLERLDVERISGKKVAVCPILRAGVGMLDAVLSLIPGARVGYIGLYRDEETLQPVEYFLKLPHDIEERDVVLLDPMLATGNSTAAAIDKVKAAGAPSVRLIAIIAAPEGVARIHGEHPDVQIVVAALDRGLNDVGFIVPGLGDAGDRLYGTK